MNRRYSKIYSFIIFACVVYCVVIMTSVLIQNETRYENINDLSVSAINDNYKSVVSVIIEQPNHKKHNSELFYNLNNKPNSFILDIGSGLIIDESGYIVTNYHVIENASKVFVKLYNGSNYEVDEKNIFIDPLTDIAVIKIDANNLFSANIGNSDNIKVGEEVIALGNPLGLFNISNQITATKGIVSAKNVDFGFNENYGRTYKGMIQTDASINPGNSGGPLLNINGQVIGLNTFVITGANNQKSSIGLNFAIPINRVLEIYNVLKENGSIDRDFNTGITVRQIDDILMNFYRLDSLDGLLVMDVERESSGDKAGIKIGDIILKVSGKAVNSLKEITKIINEDLLKTGDKIKVIVLRNNKQIELNLSLDKGGFE
tara:strand:+ start:827 stop:1948 length:1122 start_codon:yes stop_codon:yes gene_type:complete